MARTDQAEYRCAQGIHQVVVGEIDSGEQDDAGLVQTAFLVGLEEGDGGAARRQEQEDGLGGGILDPLNIRREVDIGHRHPNPADEFVARGFEGFLEGCFGIDAGTEVGDQGIDLLDALLRRVGRHRCGDLRQGVGEADDIGRLGGDH